MAKYRAVYSDFWTDTTVINMFTPEDRLVYLYSITNARTTISGCYEISSRQISFETGLTMAAVEESLVRLESYGRIRRSGEWVLITNFWRYQWSKSDTTKKAVIDSVRQIKPKYLADMLMERVNGFWNEKIFSTSTTDAPCMPHVCPIDAPQMGLCSVSDNNIYINIDIVTTVNNIIGHLNSSAGASFSTENQKTVLAILDWMGKGFKEEDFIRVIDRKSADWKGDPKMEKYLRPETLFGDKFEAYANEKEVKETKARKKNAFTDCDERSTDYDKLFGN